MNPLRFYNDGVEIQDPENILETTGSYDPDYELACEVHEIIKDYNTDVIQLTFVNDIIFTKEKLEKWTK